jgi:hypothetical protein
VEDWASSSEERAGNADARWVWSGLITLEEKTMKTRTLSRDVEIPGREAFEA